MFGLTLGKFVILIIIGALAGSMAGRVVTLSSRGFSRWINLAVGMIGAIVGNVVFYMLGIDLGWGDLKISFQDLVAAFVGSLICIIGWFTYRYFRRNKIAKSTL